MSNEKTWGICRSIVIHFGHYLIFSYWIPKQDHFYFSYQPQLCLLPHLDHSSSDTLLSWMSSFVCIPTIDCRNNTCLALISSTIAVILSSTKIFSFVPWLSLTKHEFVLHYLRGNYKAGAINLSLFEIYRSQLWRFVSFPLCLSGPISPQSVTVDSVGSDHVVLSWNISAFMQMTPHSYNVTKCTNTCDTLFYPYIDGSTFKSISIPNLTSATKYFIEVSAFVGRLDSVTGRNMTLQSSPTALQVRTGRKDLYY